MNSFLLTRIQAARSTSWVGLISALVALVAAFTIMVEKIHLLANPDYVTSCSLNAIVSCSPVMSSPQASAFFGIPNPLLGIAGFSVVACLYFVSFFTKLPRFIWLINGVGTLLALVFCFWLAGEALYAINALCLYCFIVWLTTSLLFWFSLKPVVADTAADELQFWVKLGAIVTIGVFVFMVFFAFSDYWLSLF